MPQRRRDLRRTDAAGRFPGGARFIDKQPLNFRCVDLMRALFPNARIVHCRREARDNALSL
ncbi:MAG: sulfotransferase [Xanthomonadaceae bacterium]|nr:sulfotransferase [Xanthomonadaceae bacterium]